MRRCINARNIKNYYCERDINLYDRKIIKYGSIQSVETELFAPRLLEHPIEHYMLSGAVSSEISEIYNSTATILPGGIFLSNWVDFHQISMADLSVEAEEVIWAIVWLGSSPSAVDFSSCLASSARSRSSCRSFCASGDVRRCTTSKGVGSAVLLEDDVLLDVATARSRESEARS